jgi:hypothetical protein
MLGYLLCKKSNAQINAVATLISKQKMGKKEGNLYMCNVVLKKGNNLFFGEREDKIRGDNFINVHE